MLLFKHHPGQMSQQLSLNDLQVGHETPCERRPSASPPAPPSDRSRFQHFRLVYQAS